VTLLERLQVCRDVCGVIVLNLTGMGLSARVSPRVFTRFVSREFTKPSIPHRCRKALVDVRTGVPLGTQNNLGNASHFQETCDFERAVFSV
jgi:hypothetical protein